MWANWNLQTPRCRGHRMLPTKLDVRWGSVSCTVRLEVVQPEEGEKISWCRGSEEGGFFENEQLIAIVGTAGLSIEVADPNTG